MCVFGFHTHTHSLVIFLGWLSSSHAARPGKQSQSKVINTYSMPYSVHVHARHIESCADTTTCGISTPRRRRRHRAKVASRRLCAQIVSNSVLTVAAVRVLDVVCCLCVVFSRHGHTFRIWYEITELMDMFKFTSGMRCRRNGPTIFVRAKFDAVVNVHDWAYLDDVFLANHDNKVRLNVMTGCDYI